MEGAAAGFDLRPPVDCLENISYKFYKSRYEDTETDSCNCWKKYRNSGPFYGSCFFFYSQYSCGTWPVKKAEDHHGKSSGLGPTVGG